MQFVQVPLDLATEEEFRSAVDSVVANAPRLLPPGAATVAMSVHRDEAAAWAFGQVVGDVSPTQGDVISVSKNRHGVRPVAVWDAPSTLLYAVLSHKLRPHLPEVVRGSDAWHEFQHAPLSEPGNYVVVADIASCYDMLDHGLLSEELRLQAGEHGTVVTLNQLLAKATQKTYGLPQQSESSDLLANAFLQRLERSLHRRGLRIWRYNDDFRMTCNSWSDVVHTIEVLDEEVRHHGLLLNDSKTITWRRGNYEARLEHVEQLRQGIAAEAEIDLEELTSTGLYDDVDQQDPDPEDVAALASTKLLDLWLEIAGQGDVPLARRDEHVSLLQLIPPALKILTPEPDDLPATIDILFLMLRYEQTLTPAICRYLATVNGAELLDGLDRCLASDPYLSDWQMWWLLNVCTRLSEFASNQARMAWAINAYQRTSQGSLIRAQAAVNLARIGGVTVEQLMRDYDQSSPIARPALVAALALAGPTAEIAAAIRSDSRLHEWVFDLVLQQNAQQG